jgi:hypothetical protein
MAREALQLSDACDWSQHTRPPFQIFSTKKTSRLAALYGYGISSPANGASMCSPIPVVVVTHISYGILTQYLAVATFLAVAGNANFTVMSGTSQDGEGP